MCPSSWKLYVDDFLFFGSPLAHLELELELFEVWDDGDDDLSYHYLQNFGCNPTSKYAKNRRLGVKSVKIARRKKT